MDRDLVEYLRAMEQRLTDRLTGSMDSMAQRMESMDRRMYSMEQRMESVEQRMESFGQRMESFGQRMESMERRMDSMERRMDSMEQRIIATADLVTSVSESLQREMHAGFEKIRVQLEDMGRRLDRHGSLLQTGARWTVRMAAWSERVDKGDADRDIRIGGLAARIFKMEERRPPAPNAGA